MLLSCLTTDSKKDQFKIVPILVGGLKPEAEAKFGRILSKYLIKPENFFVISSDFCHWGKYEVKHMIYKFLNFEYVWNAIHSLGWGKIISSLMAACFYIKTIELRWCT